MRWGSQGRLAWRHGVGVDREGCQPSFSRTGISSRIDVSQALTSWRRLEKAKGCGSALLVLSSHPSWPRGSAASFWMTNETNQMSSAFACIFECGLAYFLLIRQAWQRRPRVRQASSTPPGRPNGLKGRKRAATAMPQAETRRAPSASEGCRLGWTVLVAELCVDVVPDCGQCGAVQTPGNETRY